ncbi:GNAT family N-acetyltransferase [Candidatus Protochlamydia phocaeensis]|uniref:GNAT family N-acetyltransferase n=1 Tax=Candidatus Protochlamydia phocaeensis TaxID=1414722 RepID=UPI000838A6EA|nr:GNAT family N-acetyltransferase [Candidatus Protochlamydia phocaeensis]
MNQQFVIRRMKENEVQIALDWAQKEGWNPGLNDSQCFYQADPSGFFIGLLNGEPIATGAAVIYDDRFAFCGLYIVKPEFRQQGFGIQLTNERLKYVGNRITGIDGVLNNVSKYQRIGYVPAHKNTRYELSSPLAAPFSPQIIDIKAIPFKQLEAFDRQYFPAQRPHFLHSWINQSHSYALGYLEDQALQGYGVIRKCASGYKIGPLFSSSSTAAQVLFEALCSKVKEGPIYLDVPEPNQNAHLLAKHYQMNPTFEVIRMYRNGNPSLDLQGIYGMTTYELG